MTGSQPSRTTTRLQWAVWLALAYVIVSAATVGALGVLSALAPSLVTGAAWVRGVIVAATSVLLLIATRGAASGSRSALVRARIIAVVVVAAMAVVLVLVSLPLWMVAEQVLCAVILLLIIASIFYRSADA